MKPSLLSWIGSLLTLHFVSSADEPPSFTDLPSEMLDAIVRQVVISQTFDFCAYVDWLAGNRWAWSCTDVGMPMLKKIAEEEKNLDLEDDKQRVRRQQILKKVRTFVRIRSSLPIDCTGAEACKLRELAGVFESSYEECASISESSTWKKACLAGLFGRNTLSTLLEYLSKDFRRHTEEILLQTAFFINNIETLEAITKSFGILKEDVPNLVSELDILFSNSKTFFDRLFEILPNVITTKRLGLIREACSLNILDILLCLLDGTKPVELDVPELIIDSLSQLKMYNGTMTKSYTTQAKLSHVLQVAARHGHLPIIRFLWPAWMAMPKNFNKAVRNMMINAGWNNHRSVLEFLLWESGEYYTKVTQDCVKDAFEAAVRKGRVEIIKFLTGKDNDGQFIAPGLVLTKLDYCTVYSAIRLDRNWDGIKYLVDLKEEGDPRFAGFELVDQGNTVLCIACEAGDYDLVEYLVRRTDDGEFLFPHTNPAAQDNEPLVRACNDGHLRVMKLLLEVKDGKYVLPEMKGVNFTRVVSAAIERKQTEIVQFLLQVDDGTYVLPGMKDFDLARILISVIRWNKMEILRLLLQVEDRKHVLPGMNSVDFTRVVSNAIRWNRTEIVQFLLQMEDGTYVLPGMNDVDFAQGLAFAFKWNHMEIVELILKTDDGKYVLPGMNGVDFTSVLSAAVHWYRGHIVTWLLHKNESGDYVLPGMNGVDLNSVLLDLIKSGKVSHLKWLLGMNEGGEYVFPAMNGIDLDCALVVAITCNQKEVLEFLLAVENGKYVLPGLDSVNFTRVLQSAIRRNRMEMVRFLLEMNEFEGDYVFPGMNGVDFNRALKSAVIWNRMEVVRFFLEMKDGKYVLPGIRVTEDMLTIGGPSPEMRELLEGASRTTA